MATVRSNLRAFVTSICCKYSSGRRYRKTCLISVFLILIFTSIFSIYNNINDNNTKWEINPPDEEADYSELFLVNDISDIHPNSKATTPRNISIVAKSSPEEVYVEINGVMVYEEVSPLGRGINVIVINQYNGVVMDTKVFDTMLGNNQLHMSEYLSTIRNGMIIIFVVKDEASMNLRSIGISAITAFDGYLIGKLMWRDTWGLITQKGNKRFAEGLNKSPGTLYHGLPVIIKAVVTLDAERNECNWGTSTVDAMRKQFCFKYVGYESLCDCTKPSPLDLKSPVLLGNRVASLPISIIASNRPQYLYRMLRGLLTTPGVNREMVTVYIDGFHDEPAAVANLFQVKFAEHKPICDAVCRLNQHYKYTLHHTFERHPNADYMIILEEDLDVAEDIIDYFSQLLPVLASDESVYCISAWNDNSYTHSSNDPTLLYRIEGMPGLGWVLKRKLFYELEPIWPGLGYYGDWDIQMRLPESRQGRECIVPDVSRTYHFGKVGIHMNGYEDEFNGTFETVLNQRTGITFDVSKMTKDGYETELTNIIKLAEVLDHTKNPCHDTDFLPTSTGGTYVLYIKWAFKGDVESWLNIAECFHIWNVDVRGFHKISWRFWVNGNHIIVVGSSSPYIKYKPTHIHPIEVSNKMVNKNTTFDMEILQGYAI